MVNDLAKVNALQGQEIKELRTKLDSVPELIAAAVKPIVEKAEHARQVAEASNTITTAIQAGRLRRTQRGDARGALDGEQLGGRCLKA